MERGYNVFFELRDWFGEGVVHGTGLEWGDGCYFV